MATGKRDDHITGNWVDIQIAGLQARLKDYEDGNVSQFDHTERRYQEARDEIAELRRVVVAFAIVALIAAVIAISLWLGMLPRLGG